jgi:hypothetical protein
MKAVVRAILLDGEARAGDNKTPDAGEGHLREPAFFINSLLRALNATVEEDNALPGQANNMGQNIYYSASVFNYFSPGYRFTAEGSGATPVSPPVSINAPEFKILSTSTALLRANFVNHLVYGTIKGVTLNWTPYLALTAGQIVDAFNTALLHGTMSQPMHDSILKAVNAQTSAEARVRAAAYLVASSSQYQVER